MSTSVIETPGLLSVQLITSVAEISSHSFYNLSIELSATNRQVTSVAKKSQGYYLINLSVDNQVCYICG